MATKAPTTNAPAKTASDPLWILICDSDGDVHDVKNWAWLLYEALGGGNGPLDAPHREALCLVAAELQSASYRLETLHEKLFEAAKPAVGVDTPIPRGPEPGKELEVKEKKPEPGQFEGLSVEELHHEWEVTDAGMNLALAELNRDRPGDMDSSRSDAIVDQFDARRRDRGEAGGSGARERRGYGLDDEDRAPQSRRFQRWRSGYGYSRGGSAWPARSVGKKASGKRGRHRCLIHGSAPPHGACLRSTLAALRGGISL